MKITLGYFQKGDFELLQRRNINETEFSTLKPNQSSQPYGRTIKIIEKKIRCLLCIQPSTLHIKAGGIQILNKNLKINTNNSLKNIKVTYTKISNAKGKQVIGVTASGISIYN